MNDRQLHAIGGRFRRQLWDLGPELSHAQEHLFDAVMRELEQRRRRRPANARCFCDLCWAPFPE